VYDSAISIKLALVDIAYEYVKRKNVFRVNTLSLSEYLFEASDEQSMLHWIRAIQRRSAPAERRVSSFIHCHVI